MQNHQEKAIPLLLNFYFRRKLHVLLLDTIFCNTLCYILCFYFTVCIDFLSPLPPSLFQVPEPTVSITQDSCASQAVSTDNRITITCQASVSNFANTPITISMEWTERASLTNMSRVMISPATSSPPYESTITISFLISDTETYECCVQVYPVESSYINQSDIVCCSLKISAHKNIIVLVLHYCIYGLLGHNILHMDPLKNLQLRSVHNPDNLSTLKSNKHNYFKMKMEDEERGIPASLLQ